MGRAAVEADGRKRNGYPVCQGFINQGELEVKQKARHTPTLCL